MQKVEERESVILLNRGQKIFGVMHRPINQDKYPAILICHGLGGHKSGKFRLYVSLATLLSKAGIGCLRIDFRGSGDSEGEFHEMTLEGEVSDALVGLDFLSKDPHVDPQRIGLFGRSIGGAVAILSAKKFNNIKTLAMWAPVFSGEQWIDKWKLLHTEGLSQEHRIELMRINGQVPGYEFYKQLFSIQMEHELPALEKMALLHIHGKKDNIVDIEHADKYMQYRNPTKAETKFIRLDNSDHDFSDPIEQRVALDETCQWFKRTI